MSAKKIFSAITIVALAAIAIVYFLDDSTSTSSSSESVIHNDLSENAKANSSQKTIANSWKWEASETSETSETIIADESAPDNATSASLFTPNSVYNALQAVKLDIDGNVILDHDALISLDEALERIYSQLDNDRLLALQALIKESLPGAAGEQTAKLVNDYTQFLIAKDEFSELYENAQPVAAEQSIASLSNDQSLYSELQSLRELYLGKEVADQLFRISDANATFMFESLKLEADETMTAEEKQRRAEEIEARHTEQSINIANWTERYTDFISSKNTIMEALISDSEKRQQIIELLNQRFNEDERSRIFHLQLDSI